jgi:UDP-N-acetylglucosamine 1-carboxyvinyltransferase
MNLIIQKVTIIFMLVKYLATPLYALNLNVTDLRAGATLTSAALIAQGKAELSNISHIERGYENLDERLLN